MRFLVTGATGTVGVPTVLALLARGHEVVALVRAKEGVTPEERLKEALRVPVLPANLFVLPGDIELNGCGVSSQNLELWKGKIDAVLHGAASIKFNDNDGSIWQTNVEGTKHVLELAYRGVNADWFRYVSTVYVIGSRVQLPEEEVLVEGWRNEYEHSKMEAERLVRVYTDASVIRIPIVVGNSVTGATAQFEGYYGFFRGFWVLRHMILDMWQKDPEKCRSNNIWVDENGYIHARFSVPCTQVGSLQLVPRDWLAETTAQLMEIPGGQQTFHIVHPKPLLVREVIRVSLEHLGFRDMVIGGLFPETQPSSRSLLGVFQWMILKGIKPFTPYTSKDEEVFFDEQTRLALGKEWREAPAVNAEFLRRTLDYAEARNFGRS